VAKYGAAQNESEIFAYCFENNDNESLDAVETAGVQIMDDDGEIGQLEFAMTVKKGISN
jgi:hypothetical protein